MLAPQATFSRFRPMLPFLAVLLGLFVSGCGINNIPAFEEDAKAKWANVQNNYQRRADLIPNLVETVQGYATHEREVFEEVSANRSAALTAGSVAATAQADAQMTGLLGRLFAVAEAYPELKANTNFLQLQDQVANIEGELQSARRYYNATARDLNTRVYSFPDMLFATPMGFREEPYYEDADASIQSAPKIDFARPA